MRIVILMILSLSVGCGEISRNHPTVLAENQQTLSGKGEEVGVLPDGRKVVRYRLDMGKHEIIPTERNPHWVYVVDNVVTLNHEVSQGKTTANQTEVIINGVTYTPKE